MEFLGRLKAFGWVAVASLGLALSGVAVIPAVHGGQALQATDFQFGISNNGPYCAYCCWSGYCCDIPIICEDEP